MKKTFSILLGFCLLGLFVLAQEKKVIRIGASPSPHAEILNFVKPLLEKKGIEIKIIEFTDYVTPNLSLENGDVDANYFQHVPYLEVFSKEKSIKDLVSVGAVHVEPLTLYSKKIKNKSELKAGQTIAVPNDPSNEARALILLHNNGIIRLKDPKNLKATTIDIADSKGLKFKELDAAQLPRSLGDVDGAVINGNYALQAGLNSIKDGIVREGSESPYANVIVVRLKDKETPWVKVLMETLRSSDVKKFINDNYKGGVAPAF